MPANPERMRPTQLSNALIVQEANNIIGKEAFVLLEQGKKEQDDLLISRTQAFLLNKIGEPKKPPSAA